MVDDPLKHISVATRMFRPRGAAPVDPNVALLARLGAVPISHIKQKKKFNQELRKGQRHQDYRMAGFGKKAQQRYARQAASKHTKHSDTDPGTEGAT